MSRFALSPAVPERHRPAGAAACLPLLLALALAVPPAAAQDAVPPAEPLSSEPAAGAATEEAAEAPAATGREGFAAAMDYLLRDGGVWRSPNAEHRPGDGTAVEFRYRFEPLFERSLVKTAISGVGEDGVETVYWQVLTAWHPGEDAMRLYNFGHDGDVGRGTYEVVAPDRRLAHIDFTNSEGQEYRIREESEHLGPDRFRSRSFLHHEGEWRLLNEAEWTRVRE